MSGADAFPELADERERLAFSRASRDRMIERLERVDPQSAADEFTAEYVEVTVEEALEDLRSPGAGDFFGRIDTHDAGGETWYIGRRHIEDDAHDPVVVDWRAPIAAPFYRATGADPLGVDLRRRYMLDDGALTAYLDEHLDDPDAANVAGGIPDPVLAEIGAERTGAMREIVATIQAEQDLVIRAPMDQLLVVQGGPGTGKTAVALHRAAYLLFEHRRRLARDGVLVIGPNRAFLDYIGNVLPSLGERSVRQATVLDLCVPKVAITGIDDPAAARAKGAAPMLEELRLAALLGIKPPTDDVVVPMGARRLVFTAQEIGEWLDRAASGTVPFNQRRLRLRSIAQQELRRRTGDDVWGAAEPLRKVLDAAWPTQQPVKLVDRLLPGPRGRKRAWTAADQLLVDEANSILNGPPLVYGHVVVDEAQDHSAVALRVIGRRSPAASMTLVGDVAQSTTPAGQERWADIFGYLAIADSAVGDVSRASLRASEQPGTVSRASLRASEQPGTVSRASLRASEQPGTVAELTIGYRVPEPILTVANRLLPLTGVDASASRSVRVDGHAPAWLHTTAADLPGAVAQAAATMKHRHRLTGVVASLHRHDAITAALEPVGLHAVDHLHQLHPGEVPLFGPEQVKGLEFDGVVVVEPDEILGDTARGARLLYVAMTRAVQDLSFVTTSPPERPGRAWEVLRGAAVS